MSLITRCPACGTMFKVVADQLKIAQGWARCGHCSEVFDAATQLQAAQESQDAQDAEETQAKQIAQAASPGVAPVSLASALAAPPPDVQPGFAAPITAPRQQAQEASAAPPVSPPASSLPPSPAPPATLAEPPPAPVLAPLAAAPAPVTSAEAVLAPMDQEEDPSAFDPLAWKRALRERDLHLVVAPLSKAAAEESTPELSAQALASKPAGPKTPHVPEPRESATPDQAPADSGGPSFELSRLPGDDEVLAEQKASFVIQAQRKAFWKQPVVRMGMLVLVLCLSVLLMLQWTLQNKDRLAVREPRLVPWLQTLCAQMHCTLAPPRQIESLKLDSSTFTKIGNERFRLDFTLKNTSALALQVPSLEVTLTDSQARPIVRRVLAPSEFGINTATLAGRSELAGSVWLQVSANAASVPSSPSSPSSPSISDPAPLRVAGYTILAFYP